MEIRKDCLFLKCLMTDIAMKNISFVVIKCDPYQLKNKTIKTRFVTYLLIFISKSL